MMGSISVEGNQTSQLGLILFQETRDLVVPELLFPVRLGWVHHDILVGLDMLHHLSSSRREAPFLWRSPRVPELSPRAPNHSLQKLISDQGPVRVKVMADVVMQRVLPLRIQVVRGDEYIVNCPSSQMLISRLDIMQESSKVKHRDGWISRGGCDADEAIL